jgi:integrase
MLSKFKKYLNELEMVEETRRSHCYQATHILSVRKRWKYKKAITWLNQRVEQRNYSGSTRNKYSQTFSHLNKCFNWKWKQKIGWVKENNQPPPPLSDAEVLAIFKTSTTPRMDLIQRLCLTTGARPKEVRQLQAKEIDLSRFIITIPKEKVKNRIERKLVIREFMAREISAYLDDGKFAQDDFLFIYRHEKFVTANAVIKDFKKRLEMIGCLKKTTPYALRHAYGTKMAARINSLVLKEMLGHKNIKTAQAYFDNNEYIMREAAEKDERFDEFINVEAKMKKTIVGLDEYLGYPEINPAYLKMAQSYLYQSIGINDHAQEWDNFIKQEKQLNAYCKHIFDKSLLGKIKYNLAGKISLRLIISKWWSKGIDDLLSYEPKEEQEVLALLLK